MLFRYNTKTVAWVGWLSLNWKHAPRIETKHSAIVGWNEAPRKCLISFFFPNVMLHIYCPLQILSLLVTACDVHQAKRNNNTTLTQHPQHVTNQSSWLQLRTVTNMSSPNTIQSNFAGKHHYYLHNQLKSMITDIPQRNRSHASARTNTRTSLRCFLCE